MLSPVLPYESTCSRTSVDITNKKRKEKEKKNNIQNKRKEKEKENNNDLAIVASHDTILLSSFLIPRNFSYSS